MLRCESKKKETPVIFFFFNRENTFSFTPFSLFLCFSLYPLDTRAIARRVYLHYDRSLADRMNGITHFHAIGIVFPSKSCNFAFLHKHVYT